MPKIRITACLYSYGTKKGHTYSAMLSRVSSFCPSPIAHCLALAFPCVDFLCLWAQPLALSLGVLSLVLSTYLLWCENLRNEGPKGRGRTWKARARENEERATGRKGKNNGNHCHLLSPLVFLHQENIFHPPKTNGRMPSNTIETISTTPYYASIWPVNGPPFC